MNTFLLVDDDEIFNFLHREVILQIDSTADITSFTSAFEAIDFIKQRAEEGKPLPRYCFVDIRMPELNGFEMLDQLMLLPPELFDRVSIYLLSSSLDEKDEARARSYPLVAAFKGKPLSREILTEVLGS